MIPIANLLAAEMRSSRARFPMIAIVRISRSAQSITLHKLNFETAKSTVRHKPYGKT
jgi:hypothetical protein